MSIDVEEYEFLYPVFWPTTLSFNFTCRKKIITLSRYLTTPQAAILKSSPVTQETMISNVYVASSFLFQTIVVFLLFEIH